MAIKNIFIKNRLKDALRMNRKLESQYGLKPLFKYVVTTQNPADMIRGLTLKRFLSNFEFWCAGPPWLGEGPLQRPEPELPCLNKRCRHMAHASMNCSLVLDQECPSVIPIHRFSTFSRLLRVTSLSTSFWPSNWGVYGTTIPKPQSIG